MDAAASQVASEFSRIYALRAKLCYKQAEKCELGLDANDHENAKSGETVMWGGIIGLIIQLISGGVGGNIAGSLLKQFDLGVVGNTIAGVIGGGVGAQIIGQFLGGGGAAAAGAGGLDIGSIIGQIISGGAGGGVLMVIVGLIKQAMGGQKIG
jgi:hypothetical protein